MKMIKLLLVLTLICGGAYPMLVTLMGRVGFAEEASGSLMKSGRTIIGSKLLSQKFSRSEFFHSRPSASDFATVASGASQSGATQKVGMLRMAELRKNLPDAGEDAWTTSGSGLDPHISPKTALAQISRVGAARSMNSEELTRLIETHTEGPTWGIWGQPRVNVLKLNIALMNAGKNGNTR